MIISAPAQAFPPGTQGDRWDQIAEYVKIHAHTEWKRPSKVCLLKKEKKKKKKKKKKNKKKKKKKKKGKGAVDSLLFLFVCLFDVNALCVSVCLFIEGKNGRKKQNRES